MPMMRQTETIAMIMNLSFLFTHWKRLIFLFDIFGLLLWSGFGSLLPQIGQ
jgi:hypothetical protein